MQRHRAIWEELQFKLDLSDHPNAVSVLFRVLLELAIDNHIKQTNLTTIRQNDTLANKLLKVADNLYQAGKIDHKYPWRLQEDAELRLTCVDGYPESLRPLASVCALSDHLKALWDSLSELIVHCLNS